MAGSSPRQQYFHTPGLQLPHHTSQARGSRSPAFYAALPDRVRTSPMSITSNTGATPPPPLPPPRFIEGINEGSDPGWEYENRERDRNNAAPIKPGSSLLGGHKLSPAARYNGQTRNVEFDHPSRHEIPQDMSLDARGTPSDAGEGRVPDLRALLDYK